MPHHDQVQQQHAQLDAALSDIELLAVVVDVGDQPPAVVGVLWGLVLLPRELFQKHLIEEVVRVEKCLVAHVPAPERLHLVLCGLRGGRA